MAWGKTTLVNARHEFVLAAMAPDAKVAELCRDAGISRKTAYKWIQRFRERGIVGLEDMSRRPRSSPLQASGEVVMQVLELRGAHPRWGPRKLRKVLARSLAADETPSERTVARVLERAGEVRARRRRPPEASSAAKDAPSCLAEAPNDLWTVDFKGWWNSKDGAKCEPLTVRAAYSRFVLKSHIMLRTGTEPVMAQFKELFECRGLPKAIQVDNGPPFGSTHARCGVTTLSAWWLATGIRVIRGRPAHPQDNGAHERMHLDMRYEVEDVGADNVREQQAAMDNWCHEFNYVRPHDAIDLKVPGDLYRPSSRRYRGPRQAR
jgi:putative transposase